MTKKSASAKPKPRNPQDSTLRNVRATRSDIAALKTRVARIEAMLAHLSWQAP